MVNFFSKIGLATLELYSLCVGNSTSQTTILDLSSILQEMPKLLKESIIQMNELSIDDQVLAFKIPGSLNCYQILQKKEACKNKYYIYQAKKE